MAKQTGLLKLEGSIGELCFYKSQGVWRVKRKGGVSGKQIKSDPRYLRTRQNMAEFGRAVQAAKLLRGVVRSIIPRKDPWTSSRLTSLMSKVIKADVVNKRGERTVKWGAPELLQGFQFNSETSLERVLHARIDASIDRATGKMTVDVHDLSPADVITGPAGATHFRLHAVGAAIDFENKTSDVANSESDLMSMHDQRVGPLQISLSIKPGASDVLFLLFGISFVNVVNQAEIPLKGGKGSAMEIVRVE